MLLADQHRSTWDRLLIRRGFEALRRSGGGPYSVQASIAACHAQAARYEDTDWTTIAALYARLMELTPSSVVELNWAVAISMTNGPAAGLQFLEPLAAEPTLKDSNLLSSVRGDLLQRVGRHAEARAELERAASLTRNAQEQKLLLDKAACSAPPTMRASTTEGEQQTGGSVRDREPLVEPT